MPSTKNVTDPGAAVAATLGLVVGVVESQPIAPAKAIDRAAVSKVPVSGFINPSIIIHKP